MHSLTTGEISEARSSSLQFDILVKKVSHFCMTDSAAQQSLHKLAALNLSPKSSGQRANGKEWQV